MNINELKEIVKNAPEGATHFDSDGHYWHNSTAFYWLICDNGNKCCLEIGNGARLLSDIRTIIELYDASKLALEYVDNQFECKISTHNPAYIGRKLSKSLECFK